MNTDAKRYYAVLGVDPASSEEAIRVAFRRRAKELHPDSVSGSTSAFIRLKRAYDTLSDRAQRAEYDLECFRPETATSPSEPVRPRQAPPPPRPAPPPRPRRPPRAGGIGFVRYAIAFMIMGGLSFGAIEAMISLTEAPPSVSVHMTVPRATSTQSGAEPTSGPAAESAGASAASTPPGSSRSGFWDAGPAAPAEPTQPRPAARAAAAASKGW